MIVLRQQVREGLAREGLMSWLSGVFGVIASLLAAFPQVVDRHLNNDCDSCRAGASKADRPYEIEATA